MRGDGRGQVNNGLALSQWPAVHMARIFIFFLSSSSENKLRRMGGESGGVRGGERRRVGQGLFEVVHPAHRLNHMQSFSKLEIISLSSLN